MAGSLSDYYENELLDHAMMKGSFTMLTHIYVGLSTADPLDDASGNAEPSGGSYARVDTEAAAWDAASGGALDNAAAITFPTASGAWGTITHVALWDEATAGNMLAHADLDASKVVGIGDTFEIAIGDLDITLT